MCAHRDSLEAHVPQLQVVNLQRLIVLTLVAFLSKSWAARWLNKWLLVTTEFTVTSYEGVSFLEPLLSREGEVNVRNPQLLVY